MPIQLFQEAIQRRQAEDDICRRMSDWQVHSANITASAINMLAQEIEVGPLYVPMPTGSGKTIGAIWGIADLVGQHSEQRVCFLTPYQTSVDDVYAALKERVGSDLVGYYYHGALVDKADQLEKRVVVLTHQFIQHNYGALDDRDLFVVDEAIYATGEAELKLNYFFEARSWASRNNIFPDEFNKLADYAVDLDRKLRASNNKYVAAERPVDLDWARTLAFELELSNHSQTINNREVLVATQRFCEALLQGLVFLSKGNLDAVSYDPTYSAAVLGIPKIEKTIVLSATGGMVYDIAGPFKQDMGSKTYWTPPSYERLKLVQLTGPEIGGRYDSWSSGDKKDKVVRYVDWVLSNVAEDTIYMTMPKKVLEGCLREYFGHSTRGALEYPFTVTKHGKQISVSHHARSVGSNAFADCTAVVYLWDNHLPQGAAVQRFHTLANEEITEEALEDANRGQLVGNYQRIRDAQYIDNMMQQIGRGSVRKIDENAVAGEMTAYVHTDVTKMRRLAVQYRQCQTATLEYDGNEVGESSSPVDRIIWYLRQQDRREDILSTEVEGALGFELRRYKNALQLSWDLRMIGYEFEPGSRGRGNAGTFKWTRDR